MDEAGRGCLAGPVAAAAVVWNPSCADDPRVRWVIDSKKLSARRRDEMRSFIEEEAAIAWSVAFVDAAEIDRINILKATHRAMHRALDGLDIDVDLIVADGDRFAPYVSAMTGDFVPHVCVPGGDNMYLSVAAASILAKTHRDEYVQDVMHQAFPMYGWDANKGYGTQAHIDAIVHHGPCVFHRATFARVS